MRSLALALLLAACSKDESPPASKTETPPAKLASDELTTVQEGTIETGPLISGTLEPANTANMIARLGGAVREIGPEIGQRVPKGALLVKIDPGSLGAAAASGKAQVTSAKASADVAKREVERTRALVEAGALPRRDLEQAQSRYTAAVAAIDQATAALASTATQLGDATVRAPFDGVVAKRGVTAGDVVAPGTLLYQIIDPSSLRLSASVPADQFAGIEVGSKVTFSVRGISERFDGTVARVAPAADAQTRQIPILVESKPSKTLIAGLYAEGRISTKTEAGLVIPASALTDDRQPTVARISASGAIERVSVELGLRDPLRDRVIVKRGLEAGDRIVTRAAVAPAAGTKIELPKS